MVLEHAGAVARCRACTQPLWRDVSGRGLCRRSDRMLMEDT